MRRTASRRTPNLLFFQRRRRHRRFDCDWSSDVCSSDLSLKAAPGAFRLEIPPSQEFGNYALPCFSLTKIAKSAPSAIANDLHEKILPDEIIERTEVKGPYLNFFIRQALFAEKIIQLIQTNEFRRVPRKNNTVMVEFFHANTHKAVHIGHIRNICLGESLSRILEQRGSTVIRVNYQGDIGPH